MNRRAGEALLVVAVTGVALWLRVLHLGTPSLWWDELVQIRTAERPLAAALHTVRIGVSPGAGSAGAMPADYLLLHAYLAATPAPPPERLEAHFRTPACAASVLAVPALYLLGRATFGRAAGALAAWLLALSLPAILYAAEVRSYSLLTLATILDLGAFAWLVRDPRRGRRWAVHLAASLGLVFTGIFGLFVVGVQYVVLGALALRSRGTLLAAAASAGALGVVLWRYLAGTNVAAPYPRGGVVDPIAVTWASLRFFAAGSAPLLGAFVVALPLAVRAGLRRGTGAVAWAIALAFGALPAIALVIRWKHYYFHERHALFLLPLFHLVVAAGAVMLLRWIDPLRRLVPGRAARRVVEAGVVAALALAVALPGLRSFVAAPQWHFARTKTLRDLAAVTRDVAAEVRALPAGTPYVLLAERDSTANAVLSAYLRWYGIADRVTLRSPGVPLDQIEPILRAGDGNPAALHLRPAHGLYFGFRSLLGLERQLGDVPPHVSHYAVIGYATPQQGPDVRRYWNVSLRMPRANRRRPDRDADQLAAGVSRPARSSAAASSTSGVSRPSANRP